MPDINDFTRAYANDALWASTHQDTCVPLDTLNLPLATPTWLAFRHDCDEFRRQAGDLIAAYKLEKVGLSTSSSPGTNTVPASGMGTTQPKETS